MKRVTATLIVHQNVTSVRVLPGEMSSELGCKPLNDVNQSCYKSHETMTTETSSLKMKPLHVVFCSHGDVSHNGDVRGPADEF